VWLVSGLGFHASATLLIDPDWRVDLVADLDGNGKSDLIWRHRTSGATAAWFMDGTRYVAGTGLVTDPDWRVFGKGDFDGDGRDDLVWHNATTDRTAIWLMDGVALPFREGAILQLPVGWQPTAIGDLNADGRADLLFKDPSTGALWYSLRDGLDNVYTDQFGTPAESFAGLVDDDGDGATDVILTNVIPPTCVIRQVGRLLDRSCPNFP